MTVSLDETGGIPDMINVAIIGLDSSHTIEFSKRMLGLDCPETERTTQLKPVCCCRFDSPFQGKEGLDAREKLMTEMGIPVTLSFDEAVENADAIMLELNDPSMHLEYFRKVAKLGKPVFLDKPMAQDLSSAKEIMTLAKRHAVRFFSSSALRFDQAIRAAARNYPNPARAIVWGPLGIALAGSSVVWYGVHTIEILQTLMGQGAASVSAVRDEHGCVFTIAYTDGRRAIAEMTQGVWRYGGVLHNAEGTGEYPFAVETGAAFYGELLKEIERFFAGDSDGVDEETMMDSMRILDAANRAWLSNNSESVKI